MKRASGELISKILFAIESYGSFSYVVIFKETNFRNFSLCDSNY